MRGPPALSAALAPVILAALPAIAVASVLRGGLTPVAAAQAPPPATTPDPCVDLALRCPDLRMATPFGLRADRYEGRSVLRSGNTILSEGDGPASVVGMRTGPRLMRVRQRILQSDGRFRSVPSAGRLLFKAIPGQGRIWKFDAAASMEIWTMGEGRRRVRRSPKLAYCLRDLRRTHPSLRSPRRRVFGACSANHRARRLVLGTSVGWADVYPPGYYEQWVDVTGLRGCFALWHVADPLNHLAESDEANNLARVVVRLPFAAGTAGRC